MFFGNSVSLPYAAGLGFSTVESSGPNTLPSIPLIRSGSPTTTVILGVFGFLLYRYLQSGIAACNSPLSKIPGPWYAPWTTIHLRYMFARGTIPTYVEKCHHKYGEVVRLGPRHIWVADKEAMKSILMTTDLPKVTMYAEISRDRSSPGLFGEM